MELVSIPATAAVAGRYPDATVRQIREALEQDGIVVLEDIVDPAHIAALRDRMLADVDLYLQRSDRPFNWNPGNLQQSPPSEEALLFRDVLANDLAIQATASVLGSGMRNAMYSGNTALPSESRQPVHADSGQLWPHLKHPTPPYALVVNLPLVDMGPHNGSTEIWPGTHVDPTIVMQDGDIEVRPEHLAARLIDCPPLQPVVRAGSAVIRDMRLWHAGMPNHSATPRPMVAMIHYVAWWNTGDPLTFPTAARARLEHPELTQAAQWTDAKFDHIAATEGYKYEPNP